jgi:hypothetical protein
MQDYAKENPDYVAKAPATPSAPSGL